LAGGANHLLQLAGEERGTNSNGFANNFVWDTLELGLGQSLTLQQGGSTNASALYVGTLTLDGGTNQISSITGNGLDIYYDITAAGNSYLAGKTYALNGGGFIEPTAAPRLSSITVAPAGGVVVQFNSVPGRSYTVEYSADLRTWNSVAGAQITSPSAGVAEWKDDGSLTGGLGSTRFYRVTVQ
jgi:hypothetical protein